MDDDFEYDIGIREVDPAFGGKYRYISKVRSLVRKHGTYVQIVPPSEHNIGEIWAVTEQEAKQTIESLICAWIASQVKTPENRDTDSATAKLVRN